MWGASVSGYQELIGKNVKVIYYDGIKVAIVRGTFLEHDKESVKVFDFYNNAETYVPKSRIVKIELGGEPNNKQQ